jgi:adenine specific DNA methylase Mod
MYQILPYSYQQAKRLNVFIKPSENPKKKIDVYKDSKKVASIGDPNYQDYAHYLQKDKTLADNRRRLYHLRHKGESDKVGTPGYYSMHLLW